MCMTNVDLGFLKARATRRRQKDKLKPTTPSRPHAENREESTLCYAISSSGKRYVGYAGLSGGMSALDEASEDGGIEGNRILGTDQAKRRIERLEKANLPTIQPGVMHGAKRPFCRCAEAAAASIAISHGENVGDLTFVAFIAPQFSAGEVSSDEVYPPCPNCSIWLNQYAGGYITRVDKSKGLIRDAEKDLKTNPESASNLIINPPRPFKDTPFGEGAKRYVHRCFGKC